MTQHAKGTFEVKVVPQPADDPAAGPFSRLFLDKQFKGDSDAASKGQMMGAGTAVEGSVVYVAFELVTGTLSGRAGTFVLQHAGTMRKGATTMVVTVVPDSGTGDLCRPERQDDHRHRRETALSGPFRILSRSSAAIAMSVAACRGNRPDDRPRLGRRPPRRG